MKSYISTRLVYLFTVIVCLSPTLMASVYINCNYFEGIFDDAGFSDVINWGGYPENANHPYNFHEVLSGEWGAAIFYDGLSTDPNAMWLTPEFLYPYWYTNSTFYTAQSGDNYDNLNNPVSGYDTDQSKIVSGDGKVEITIDYEIVDLGDGNFSPIAITDSNGQVGFVKSDRFLFLQTYTITNLQEEDNVTGLEFYQLLHSHGADEYGPYVHASYTAANYGDLLADYTPYNQIHQVGNFMYDFTQWNNLNESQAGASHVDWVSFSCTIAPNVYDCNIYEGHSYSIYKPPVGTHYHVEERNLNNVNYAYGETAGAMGWYLPDLAPGQSTSITVAFMFGYGPIDYNEPIPPGCENLTLTKNDDAEECVIPSIDGWIDIVFDYNICYSIPCEINDIKIVDTLPTNGLEFVSATGTYDYNDLTKTVTWDLGDIDPCQNGGFILTVKVASDAIQGSTLTNTARMYSGDTLIKTATEHTKVCCQGNIVYVDATATEGANNGSSWSNAYIELYDALDTIRSGQHGDCINQIWVANGTYCPTTPDDPSPSSKTFTLIDGINIYGHFAGGENSIDERNLADTNNTTTLSGDITGNGSGDVLNVVTAANGRLDGFTVEKSSGGSGIGIFGSTCLPTIANCVVKDNGYSGIYMGDDTHAAIINTFVTNNDIGIYGSNNNSSTTRIDINECTVSQNSSYGLIGSNGCTVNAADCIFGRNGIGIYANSSTASLFMQRCDVNDNTGKGISISGTNANIQRCRIQRNSDYGIYSTYSDANVVSNIVSGNNSSGIYITYGSGNIRLLDNMIYDNSGEGIKVNIAAEIRNNTIISNDSYGISGDGDPNINSNIIWGNANSLNGSFTKVNYNCIQGGHSGIGNIDNDPCFRNADANDFHLIAESNCINAGNLNFVVEGGETDIDGEDRIMNSRVDIGADEVYRSQADYDLSGIVNFADFAILAGNWQDANENISLDDDNDIDVHDLTLFCADWLWQEDQQGYMMDIGGRGAYFEDTGGQMQMMMSESSLTQTTLPAEQAEPQIAEVEPVVVDVNEILDWLDNLWETDEEVRSSMDPNSWLEFIESIKSSE